MSSVPISNLPATTALNGTEQLPGVQTGITIRMTVQQLVAFLATQGLVFNPALLPTTLPATAGIVWNDGGVVSIS